MTMDDSRVCRAKSKEDAELGLTCYELHGKIYPIKEVLSKSKLPPLHERCRCYITPVKTVDAKKILVKIFDKNIYSNKDGHLPEVLGRIWYEVNINYMGSQRNGERVVYSNDGLIFITYDNGRTFVEILFSNYNGKPYNGIRNPNVDFTNSKGKSTLNTHWDKPDHGIFNSSEEYLNAARNFFDKPPTSTTQSFTSKDGWYFRYDTSTNEFGIINKFGGISTYFFPGTGIAYWLEQIGTYAP